MALNIKIDDVYFITNDKYNIILNEKRPALKAGGAPRIRQRFYPRVEMALEAYIDLSANGEGILVDTLDKYVRLINNARNQALRVMRGFKTKEDIF